VLENKLPQSLAPIMGGLGKIFIAEITEIGKLGLVYAGPSLY
jgi:hypothetical protein